MFIREMVKSCRSHHYNAVRIDCQSMIITFRLLVIFLLASTTHAAQDITMFKLPKTMRAVGLYKYLPITDVNSLVDLEVSLPSVLQSDVLVEVKATALNPIDTKVRAPKPNIETSPRILGWDGAGIVVSKGANANLFNVGDEVFFTGSVSRNGSNAQYMAVDQYLVGRKPKNWTFEQAAAMPLTTLTAFESICDRLLLSEKDKGKSLLVINSAGGVGSVATQIGKNLGLKVIGTASRPETQAFTREFGADIVLNHTQDLIPQLEANGFGAGVDFILVNFDPAPYWDTLMKAIKPQGRICLIVDSSALVDLRPLKDKSITLVSEMMFTRVKYNTEDRIRQYEIFQQVSKWLEDGKLKTTLTKTMGPINAANLREAHKLIEEKKMIGKLVLSGKLHFSLQAQLTRRITAMESLPKTMRAVGLYRYLPIEDPDSLLDVEVSLPSVKESDVLVEVKATGVNPIDAKRRAPKPNPENPPQILGADGAGIVVSKGAKANLWNIGDEVFFTGDSRRTGSNAQYIAVDQFQVGRKPKSCTFEQAAAMPVISLTTFESFYDRLLISEKDKGKSLLVINSAGGVGSVATQVGKNLGLKVIGTASRPETQAFTRQFGADIVLNHTQDLIPQLEANGFGAGVDFILVNFDPAPYWDTLMKAIKPQGRICLIVDSSALVDLRPLKDKSITLVSEMMSTRVKYDTEDRIRHYELLKEISQWLEEGKLKCTLTKTMSPINAANLKQAHKLLEDKTLIGKLVISGF